MQRVEPLLAAEGTGAQYWPPYLQGALLMSAFCPPLIPPCPATSFDYSLRKPLVTYRI